MLLFKYFEKRAKDGLPDPNGPLSPHVPSDKSINQPSKTYPGDRGVSVELVASEGRKSGPYNR